MPVNVRFEQAVYGSFPFWDRGYAILASSPGCREEWLADFRAACQRYGERPQGAADAGGLLALKLPSGPWAIIGPCPQGCDDRGRPGAVSFHALFLSGADYRRAGAFPFDLAAQFHCRDWTEATTSLPSGMIPVDPVPSVASPTADPLAARIAQALARGRRVAIEAPGPIDDLARQVWLALPLRRRARLSLATWTFGNDNRHDLAALPRLANVRLDRSYLDPAALLSGAGPPPPERADVRNHVGRAAWLGLAALALVAVGFAWHERPSPGPPTPSTPAVIGTSPAEAPPTGPSLALTPAQQRRIAESLLALCERFGLMDGGLSADHTRPDALMMRLAKRLAYRDSLLTPGEVAAIAASSDPDRDRVLAWHAHIGLFRPDRPLPPDFTDAPIDRQLRALARSFHINPGNRPAEEIPRLLSEALSVPVPARPSPLAAVYPALGDYSRFLRRLPPQ